VPSTPAEVAYLMNSGTAERELPSANTAERDKRHPTEVRLVRYGASSTRLMGAVSCCSCGRSSTLALP
jgi:hypothetical protein